MGVMRSLPLTLIFLTVIATSASAITFDDGLTHTIDPENSFPFEGATMSDGPGSTPTLVEIIAGGEIATAVGNPSTVSGSSGVDIKGGMIGHILLTACDSATISLQAGGTAGS
jgi:hypothetical protein